MNTVTLVESRIEMVLCTESALLASLGSEAHILGDDNGGPPDGSIFLAPAKDFSSKTVESVRRGQIRGCKLVLGAVYEYDGTVEEQSFFNEVGEWCGFSSRGEAYVINEITDREVDLSHAVLSGSELHGINLRGANLEDSDFSDAFLLEASLDGASMDRADFSGADLRRASLCGVSASDARFVEVSLWETDMCGASLQRSDFSKSDLTEVRLNKSNLYNADFSDTKLYRADLGESYMVSTNFRNSDLADAKIFESNLQDADLENASLFLASLVDSDFSGANLRNADMRNADMRGAYFCGADLQGAKINTWHFWEGSVGVITSYELKAQFSYFLLSQLQAQDEDLTEEQRAKLAAARDVLIPLANDWEGVVEGDFPAIEDEIW